ncbi:MAG: hypothetical protein KAH18_04475 [Psychromonas sp.]|nr:hypothetical protein [Psychromonas sp.]
MRLSKKGFNNVLIFGILTVIFIFNFGHKLLPSSKKDQQTVINKALTIVEIKTPDFSIKRSGRGWISVPKLGLSNQQLSKIVHTWQTLLLQKHASPIQSKNPFIIQIYTANKDQSVTVKLIQYGKNYLLQIDKKNTLLLNSQQLPLFLGR